MPVLSPVLNEDNSVGYSLGIQFKLRQVFKNGDKREVRLIKTAEKDVFYGLFDVEDTDFEIIVNNGYKNMAFDVKVPNSGSKKYYIKAGQSAKLRALETNGKHLHFLSQSTEEGKILVGMSAQENRISYEEAAVNCSRIGFSAQAEKRPHRPESSVLMHSSNRIEILIKTLTGKVLKPRVNYGWTVDMVKDWIEDKEGIPFEQLKLFSGDRQTWLMGDQTLGEIGVFNGSVFLLVLRHRGGGSLTEPNLERGVLSASAKRLISASVLITDLRPQKSSI